MTATEDTVDISSPPTSTAFVNPSYSTSDFYFKLFVIIVGIIGCLANGIVFYILSFPSRKMNKLVLNQTALDFFSCLCLFVTYSKKLAMGGASWDYWSCIFIGSEMTVWIGLDGSTINLCILTLERYVMVVHSIWHRKYAKDWMIYTGIAFSWITGVLITVPGWKW